MRDMSDGDGVLFYHSTCAEPGVYGIAKVVGTPHPDASQFEPGKYFESRATAGKPVWFCVDVAFVRKFVRPFLLSDIRKNPALADMAILRKGNRLSITPVSPEEFELIGSGG